MFLLRRQTTPHLILVISDDGVLCAPHHVADMPLPAFVLPSDQRSIAAIVGLATQNPDMPVTLLADTPAQDFRRETVPRMNPFDRFKLIRRRLQQAFPQARLAASLYAKGDRTQVLLAGLQNGGPVFEWLDRLVSARPNNPPRICLLPVEGASLVARLLPEAAQDWGLLLSHQRNGGFRQIVTYKGELVFTRLTPPAPPDIRETAATIARDIQASRDYLNRLGLSDRASLHAAFVVPNELHEPLLKTGLPVHASLFLTPCEAAHRLDLPFMPPLRDPYGDWVFAGWLARQKKPHLAMMPTDLRQARVAAQVKRWGMRTALVCLMLALGMAGLDAGDFAATLLARQKEAAQLAALDSKLAQERAAAEPVTQPLGRLRQALERQRIYGAPMPSPRMTLIALDQGLGAQARLVKFDWQNDTAKPEDDVLHVGVRLVQTPDISNRETTVAKFKQIAQNLARAMPDRSVTVVRYPFPALPHEALSNNAPEDKNAPPDPTAEFLITKAAP